MTAPKPHPFVTPLPIARDQDNAPVGIDWETIIEKGLIKHE